MKQPAPPKASASRRSTLASFDRAASWKCRVTAIHDGLRPTCADPIATMTTLETGFYDGQG